MQQLNKTLPKNAAMDGGLDAGAREQDVDDEDEDYSGQVRVSYTGWQSVRTVTLVAFMQAPLQERSLDIAVCGLGCSGSLYGSMTSISLATTRC
jgi:hypothetical protein